MKEQQKVIIFLLTLLLIGSSMPFVTGASYAYDRTKNVQLFLWPSSRLVALNQSVTIAVVLWKPGEGGIAEATVTIENNDRLYNVTTNENGFATLNLTFMEEGSYEIRATYGDISTSTWIEVRAIPPYLFIEKELMLQVNRTYTVEWDLVTPYFFTPYTGSVNVTIIFNNREVGSNTINVTDGKLELTFEFNEPGAGEILLDGRRAAYFEVYEKMILTKLIAPEHAYPDQNVTVHVFAWDAGRRAPYSGDIALNIVYENFTSGDVATENFTIGIRDGYGNFTITIPDCDYVSIATESGEHTLWVERLADTPTAQPSNGTPIVFTITPEKVLAKPGQSLSFVVNTTEEGTYNMTVTWYYWNFKSWDIQEGETNTTLITFNGTKSVIKRIEVPEWAYYGEVRIGNAIAKIYTLKPNIWTEVWANLTYSPETGLQIGDTLLIWGELKNETKDWFYEWEDFYKGLVNETLYVFTPWGIETVKTEEDGKYNAKIFVPSEKLPDMIWDRLPEVLVLHRSGVYEDKTVDTPRARVFVNITTGGVRINVEPSNDWMYNWNLITPAVLEFGQAFEEHYIGNVTSIYVNSSSITVSSNISPGGYLFRVLPNHWLCLRKDGGSSCHAGSHSTERTYFVTIGLELPNEVTYTGGELEVPIKLPSKGVFYYSYYNDQEHLGVGFTDENGNGVIRIEIDPLPQGEWSWMPIKFGFVSDSGALFDIDWDLVIKSEADVLPPSITASVTPQVQEVGKNVTIYIDVRDDVELKQVNYTITNVTDLIKGESFNVSGSWFSLEFNFTIRGLEDYVLNIMAVDRAGHVSTYLVNFFGKLVETKELNLTANETHELNVGNQAQIIVAPAQNESIVMNVTVASAVENESARVKITGSGYEDLKYVRVETNETVEYSWVILNLTYSDEMLKRLGISENAVTLHYWNGTEWIDLSKHVGETIPDNSPYGNITVFGFGRDSVHNYVWANVSHLSEYALAVKLPDLTVVDITPTTAYTNENTNVIVKIKNLGGDVDASFKVVLYINGEFYDAKELSGIREGEVKEVQFSWTPLTNKTYTVKAIVDYDGTIYESNENNNEKTTTISVMNKEATGQVSQKERSITAINFLYYIGYKRLSERFNELYGKSVEIGIDNETLQEAIKYKELAEEHYKEAQEYGPIIANISNVKILAPLRKAYLNLKKAVEILENAISSS
ncbi:hypothetical protein DRN32_01310 [Thermococci archaeon]|nr:MAG: hypothetical protein DRN32_01310 [Thermococci archaeon]